MNVTSDLLQRFLACSDEIATFGELWPDGCEVTAASVKKARNAGLNVRWFVSTLTTIRSRADMDAYAAELRARGKMDDYSDLLGLASASAQVWHTLFDAKTRLRKATDAEMADIITTLDDGLVYGTTYDTVSVDARSPLKP